MFRSLRCMLVLLLAVTFMPAFSWAVSSSSEIVLSDIQGHWAQRAIEKVVAIGLDKGFQDQTFKPNQPVGNLDAVTMILKGSGYNEQIAKLKKKRNSPPSAYPVPTNQNYMDFAVQQKILPQGMLQNFKYDNPINRAQLATVLAKTFYLVGNEVSLNFTDTKTIPQTYLADIQAVVQKGLMSGYPDGTFRPFNTVSRGELAAIMSKVYDEGWLQVDSKRLVSGWVAGVTQGKNGWEIQLNSLKGSQKVVATLHCKAYFQGHALNIQQIVNYRLTGILNEKKRLAYVELLERRNFSPVQNEKYGSYLRHAEGEPVVLTVKNLINEEEDYPVAWDAQITDEKSKSKSSKDLLKKLKEGQFVKLGLTSGGTIKELTLLDVKTITGVVDSVDRALSLERKGSGSSKKYVPDHFYGWDFGRLVDKEGDEIGSISPEDKVKITYIGEPFYERVLEIEKQ